MAIEQGTLKIKAERLGTVSEVKELLTDIENAYNSIYAFDFIVDTLANDRNRQFKELDERLYRLREYWRESTKRKEYPFDPFFFDLFFDDYRFRARTSLPSLLELQSKIDIDKIIIPDDRLSISKVNIQSPGFWEFLGGLNPLQQIREYIKDRHERQKDKKYRSRQEEQLGELTILEKQNTIVNQRIEILRGLGYSETEIRQAVIAMVITPLRRLDRHQDNGQIETPEE